MSTNFETEFPLLAAEFKGFKEDVEQKFQSVEGQIGGLRAEIREWMREDRGRLKSWWPIIVVFGAIAWWAVKMQTSQTDQRFVAIETKAVEQAQLINSIPTIMVQNADSIRDRNDQRARQEHLDNRMSDLERKFASEESQRIANEREIETQFDADSQLRNIQWANLMRRSNMFENALSALGATFPKTESDPYFFPNISSRQKGER